MILKFLKIGATPVTLIYPLPLASFLAFSLSADEYFGFLISYIFAFFTFTAVNLWNHINDAEDDLKAGREHAEFLIKRRSAGVVLVIIFLFMAFLVTYFYSKQRNLALLCFFIGAAVTWIYSDKIFLGKYIRRFKEEYRREITTYLLSTSSFFILFWTFFSEVSLRGLLFALVMSLMYLSGFLLKDIKDISADSEAGYRTLAVVFSPSALLKASISLMWLVFTVIAISSLLRIFPESAIFTLIMVISLFYTTKKLRQTGWRVTEKAVKPLKIYVNSYPLTVLLLSLLSLVSKISS